MPLGRRYSFSFDILHSSFESATRPKQVRKRAVFRGKLQIGCEITAFRACLQAAKCHFCPNGWLLGGLISGKWGTSRPIRGGVVRVPPSYSSWCTFVVRADLVRTLRGPRSYSSRTSFVLSTDLVHTRRGIPSYSTRSLGGIRRSTRRKWAAWSGGHLP